jgi:putative ABC transport system permease protein
LINRLVVENLKHRPLRTLLTALSIGFQVTMILTLVGLSRGMLEDAQNRARGVNADIFVRPPGTSVISIAPPSMPQKLLDYFLQQAHIVRVAGTVVYPIGGVDSVTGIDLEAFNAISGGFRYLDGGPFRGPYEAILDEWYAQQSKKRVGDTLRLMNKDWRVVGVVEPGKLARVFVPLRTLQELTGSTGKLSQAFLKLDDPRQTAAVIKALKQELTDYPIYSMEELVSLFSVGNVPGLKAFIYVIIGVSVVVGFLVVSLTMYAAVLERTREIGILKALGAYPADIMGLLVRETLTLALGGWVIGVLLSFASKWAINYFVRAKLQAALAPDWWPIALGIAVAAALLGAVYPGLRAARQDAIEALAYE